MRKAILLCCLYLFQLPIFQSPPPGFFQKSNRNNKNTDVIIIHNSCLNLDNGCKVKEKRCNCKIFVRIIAEKISKIKKIRERKSLNSCSPCMIWSVFLRIEILKVLTAFIAQSSKRSFSFYKFPHILKWWFSSK